MPEDHAGWHTLLRGGEFVYIEVLKLVVVEVTDVVVLVDVQGNPQSCGQ